MVNENFRDYILSSGKIVYAGKSAEQNDLLVELADRNDFLLHTVAPGSPFVNLGKDPTKEEINEASIFCALKSQFWRDNKKDVKVHLFLKSNCKKNKDSDIGSWNVSKIISTINVNKNKIIDISKNV